MIFIIDQEFIFVNYIKFAKNLKNIKCAESQVIKLNKVFGRTIRKVKIKKIEMKQYR